MKGPELGNWMGGSYSTHQVIMNEDLTKTYDLGNQEGDESVILKWIVMKCRKYADLIHLDQDGGHCSAFVKMIMNF
jgi:hypothetical protein